MQFKVPQDVQQADRIVAFLTLPQLIICVVGFGFAYAVYTILIRQGLPGFLWFPPVAFIGLLTAAFAFLKIANLPFHRYLILLLERILMPSKRVWVKGADRVIVDENTLTAEDRKIQEAEKKAEALHVEKEEGLKNISEITDFLDTVKKEEAKTMTTSETRKEPEAMVSKPTVIEASKPVPLSPALAGANPMIPAKKKRKRKRKKKGIEPAQTEVTLTAAAKPENVSEVKHENSIVIAPSEEIVAVEAPPPPALVKEVLPPMVIEKPSAPPEPSAPSQTLSAEDLRKGATVNFNP